MQFPTKGGITSLYHTGHFTQVFTLLTQQMSFRTKDAITSLYHTGHLPRLHQWQDLTLLTANVVPNEGWHYFIVSHRALYPGYMERSYTAGVTSIRFLHVVLNEGWHYLTVPHRALFPGYYTADSANVAPNEEWHYLIIPHWTLCRVIWRALTLLTRKCGCVVPNNYHSPTSEEIGAYQTKVVHKNLHAEPCVFCGRQALCLHSYLLYHASSQRQLYRGLFWVVVFSVHGRFAI